MTRIVAICGCHPSYFFAASEIRPRSDHCSRVQSRLFADRHKVQKSTGRSNSSEQSTTSPHPVRDIMQEGRDARPVPRGRAPISQSAREPWLSSPNRRSQRTTVDSVDPDEQIAALTEVPSSSEQSASFVCSTSIRRRLKAICHDRTRPLEAMRSARWKWW